MMYYDGEGDGVGVGDGDSDGDGDDDEDITCRYLSCRAAELCDITSLKMIIVKTYIW